MFSIDWIVHPVRIGRFDQRRAQMLAEHRLDLLGGRFDDRLVRLDARERQHRLADDADAHALRARPRCQESPRVAAYGLVEHGRARDRREHVARVVVAVTRILQRVEHLRRIGDAAAVDAGAVVVDVRADRAAVERDQRLVRQDQRDRVVIRGAAARRARLLAQAAHHQVRADRHAGAGARSERGRARRVVRIRRVAGPRAALIAERRDQDLVRRRSCRPDLPRGRCIPWCSPSRR